MSELEGANCCVGQKRCKDEVCSRRDNGDSVFLGIQVTSKDISFSASVVFGRVIARTYLPILNLGLPLFHDRHFD